MNRTIVLYLTLFGFSLLWSCVPPSNRVITDIDIRTDDPIFRQIHEFQDRQQVDSLYSFFHHEDPTYRYLAAMAFGSIKAPSANDSLAMLLDDPIDAVRAAAAYAIGQAGDASGEALLKQAFARQDTGGVYRQANRAILEAVGKCGTEESLQLLASITTYQTTDTALLEGQAWGIYRFALRKLILPEGTSRMLDMATGSHYPPSVRLIAANYLMRADNIKLDSMAGEAIGRALETEESPDIRMALAAGLGKAPFESSLNSLIAAYRRETDYRVQCNILRALGKFDYARVQATVLKALKSPNPNLAQSAVSYFLDNGIAQDAVFYWRTAKDTLPWPIQLGMYQAANRHLPAYSVETRDAINGELRQRLRTAGSVYEKAAAIRALSEFGWNFRHIYQEGFSAESPVIRTATMEALAAISDRTDFRAFFGEGYRQVRRELIYYFMQAMQSGDPAMIAIAAGGLRNERLNYQTYIDTVAIKVLDATLAKLELPKEIETYNELNKTITFLRNEPEPAAKTPEFNHPIDWAMLAPVSDGKHAVIRTGLGDIELAFMPEAAPGTVANFVALARQGFYAGKVFHRVVPNFVIQGGCPRGDGYGSLDYSIRSELPLLHYDAGGYVGMASAGNHTECTQFFITHSPTPHLDGNYTIFARVVQGMETVNQVQVGAVIEDILIQ
ncbi:MAG: peptidylprolyl isomerase [Phaeodactylibacter sp.]|nr:peptidylprolyl isomerase [Phaeodactylibacter sp.]MCB9276614.1 peptidylprolyl isomerase [Lewinellaceae bacterium]